MLKEKNELLLFQVKLMEKYPYTVELRELRKIIKKAQNDKKNAHGHIVGKLMPLLFSRAEMANSRGQGIKPSQVDKDSAKPVLNENKVAAIKGSVYLLNEDFLIIQMQN